MVELWSAVACHRFSMRLQFRLASTANATPAFLKSGGKPPHSKWAALALAVLIAGCQQEMARQPSFKPLDASDFFADGRSARPLEQGTVPRGYLREDIGLWTGRRAVPGKEQDLVTGLTPQNLQATVQPKQPQPFDEKKEYADFINEFPFPVTEQIVQHGYQRFMIYCVVCHDPLGTGQGKIVERGYTRPPSYHIDRLRRAAVGHFFAVISEGYGSMPSYAAQIPVRDRWAIAAYIRALQLSQHAPAAEEGRREKGEGGGEKGEGRTNASPLSPHPSPLIPAAAPKPGVEPREQAP